MYLRSQRWMLIINNRFLSLYDYNFLLVNQRLEKIFLEKPDWKKIWSEISKGWSGTCFLLTSIFTFFFFGEIRNLTTFTRLMDYNNGISLSFFFNLFLSFLWIGAQFPQEKFLSYGRILTLDYYFLLMCILFHYNNSLHSYFLYLFFLLLHLQRQ